MQPVTRDDILKADDLPSEAIDIPQWGGSVTVRTMTGTDRDEFHRVIQKRRSSDDDDQMDMRGLKAMLLQRTITNGNGELMFKVSDLAALGAKSPVAIDLVYDLAARLNGLSAEDVEELVGNSSRTASGDSGST